MAKKRDARLRDYNRDLRNLLPHFFWPAEYSPLLFRTDKFSLGVSRIGVATPWDDCPYAKSNANTFVRAQD